ncbi:MAG TPA: sialate O-acetylesterase [Polyangiaceae bacterium]|nr:sialate O-acetylesterase [Polyangiaceae bacterium]
MTRSTSATSSGRSCSRPRSRGWILCFALAACGVQEHLHEQVDTGTGGTVFKPPPPGDGGSSTASGGTGPSANGGASNGGTSSASGGANQSSGGASDGRGGSTSGGANNASGGSSGNPARGGAAGAAMGGQSTASGGRSGVTVDINGTMLPKEDVIAFVHFGHSNMFGYGSNPPGSKAYHFTDVNLRAWQYHGGKWSPALERTAGSGTTGAGPGTALMKQAVDLAPSRYFVSLGYGVGSAYCSQFLRGGLYYDEFMAGPLALKGKVTFGAIVIMLGITERHGTDQDISNFPNCINDVVTSIRTDLGEPNLPLLLCDYEMGATGDLAPTAAFAQKIIPKIREVPNVVSRSALVATDGLAMQDDHHFNLDGQKEWAKRALTIMKDKGWFLW